MRVKRVLVSQTPPANGKLPFSDITERYGVKFDFRPFIKVEHIPPMEFRRQKVNIEEATCIVFTSKVGVDHFFKLCNELRIKISDQMRYVCKSELIGSYLQNYIQLRKRKVFSGPSGSLQDMFATLEKHAEEKFLFVLPDNNNDELIGMLEQTNLNYQIGLMYRTVSNDFEEGQTIDSYDLLIFYSPEGINALKKNFPEYEQGERYIGCLGEGTAMAVKNAGLRVDIAVGCKDSKHTSLQAALTEFFKENYKGSHK